MILDVKKSRFGDAFIVDPRAQVIGCTPWGYCKPSGSGTNTDNIIGSAAFTLSCLFGKTGTACAGMTGQQVQTPMTSVINQYIPILLLLGGGVLLVSFMRK